MIYLLGQNILDGKLLLEKLARRISLHAAFWVHYPEPSLVISSPMVDSHGSLPVYHAILAAAQEAELILPRRIYAVSVDDPVVKELAALPPNFKSGEFVISTIYYLCYAPYLEEGQSIVRGYVYQLDRRSADSAQILGEL